MSEQLHFTLKPENPNSFFYFISHSGVFSAYCRAQQIIEEYQSINSKFSIVVFSGPRGSGKTHLVEAIKSALPKIEVCIFDFAEYMPSENFDQEIIREFINIYEFARTNNKLLLVTMRTSPDNKLINEHIRTRLSVSRTESLDYPQESELPLVLQSLSERYNLTLSAKTISYLVQHLPLDTLSFESIISKVNEESLKNKIPVKLGLLKRFI